MTWAHCECGCGFEGEDDVTQFCVEEAMNISFDAAVRKAEEEEAKANAKPGEITDPAVQAAMDAAKRLHEETYGVHVQ